MLSCREDRLWAEVSTSTRRFPAEQNAGDRLFLKVMPHAFPQEENTGDPCFPAASFAGTDSGMDRPRVKSG